MVGVEGFADPSYAAAPSRFTSQSDRFLPRLWGFGSVRTQGHDCLLILRFSVLALLEVDSASLL